MKVVCFALLIITTSWDSQKYGPAVSVTFPNYKYDVAVASLKEFDFKNQKYPLLGSFRKLKNGEYKKDTWPKGGDEEIKLEKVQLFDDVYGKSTHALLEFDCFSAGASSSDEGVLLVISLRDNKPAIVQELEYDRQADTIGDKFDPKTGRLIVTARSDDGTPHCCPEHVDIVTFKWNGQSFTRVSVKTVLSTGRT